MMKFFRSLFQVKPKPEEEAILSPSPRTSGDHITQLAEGANLVDGKQTWELAEVGKSDLATMLRCCEAELATMRRTRIAAAPFYFERAAILLRKDKQYAREIQICERYIQAVEKHYSSPACAYEADVRKGPRYLALTSGIPKARALQNKAKGGSWSFAGRNPPGTRAASQTLERTTAHPMARLPCFQSAHLEAACRVLADTTNGLSGTEIQHLLVELEIEDPTPGMTKWKRLFNALAEAQNKHQVGNHLILFINRAMAPVRYTSKPQLFAWRQDELNVALAFAGYAVNSKGQVVHTTPESTVEGALARARRLTTVLQGRGTHQEIFKYCKSELLQDNYFHAVLEAVKGVAERLREMSGLGSDGADLINTVFSVKKPILAINSLKTETELSEQKGIANLLVGVFGAIRNPTAHAPKVVWAMPEQDAIDILGILSYVHRKLDGATKV